MLGALLLALGLWRGPTVASTVVTLQTPGPISLAWDDPNPADPTITGFTVYLGSSSCAPPAPQPCQYPTAIPIPRVTAYTTPTLPAGTYFLAVATNATGGVVGPASAEVSTAAPYQNPCVFPTGASWVTIFVTQMMLAGSQGTLYFQLASPNSPIISVQIFANGLEIDNPAAVCNAADKTTCTPLTRDGARWFDVPTASGTYPLSVVATNAAGCSATATKDALGNPLSFTVK